MRLFFAILIPDEQVGQVTALQDDLKERVGTNGVRWTRPDQFHYTLKFLGEQGFQRAEVAVHAAEEIASETGPFQMALGGIGAFPSAQRPSTVWLGANEGSEELATLAAWLDDVLSRRGFPKERKAVKAHLTLARIKSYEGEEKAARALRASSSPTCGSFVVERFALMRSITNATGSEYSVLKEFELVKRET
jgi:2'-5' RNA ligase